MKNIITKLFLEYQENISPETYKELYNAIMQYVYNFPEKQSEYFSEYSEHNGDFLIFIEPKIPSFIERFVYTGTPFEAYLYQTLRYQMFSYFKKYRKRENQQVQYLTCYKFFGVEAFTKETEEKYANLTSVENQIVNLNQIIDMCRNHVFFNVICRRFWLYLLKNYTFISDVRMYELSTKLGISRISCQQALAQLQEEKEAMLEKRNKQNEKCTRIYARYLDKVMTMEENRYYLTDEEKDEMREQINQLQESHQREIEKFYRKHFRITNVTLSKVLGVPKNKVDAEIFHFRRTIRKIRKERRNRRNRRNKSNKKANY